MTTNDSVITDYTSTDDAAVVRLDNGKIILQTVDFFTPIVDDPYTFGQISAANSLSDIYAMGGHPLFALNIVAFPIQKLSHTILSEIMQGGADKAAEAGIPIVGGHSIDDNEPKYGLVVTGEAIEENIWTNSGAKPGDQIILTKPIGTGIISTAIKKEKVSSSIALAATESMKTLNKKASEIAQKFSPNAVTDVTGFGLVGHLIEICNASDVSANINYKQIEFLPGAIDLVSEGIIPGGSKRNLDHAEKFTVFRSSLSSNQKLLACDAQTSGGLLLTFPPDDAEEFLKAFGAKAKRIGEIVYKKTYSVAIDN
jgi:selenide,water dikinase|tara:strand:+ start:7168 stop:8103 length:936 start_codon:yes stop_codon:yes gene_type:complete